MKRPTPPEELTAGFHTAAFDWYRHGEECPSDLPLRHHDGGPACWLHQFDEYERPCSGRLEGIHLLRRQRIRHYLGHQLLGSDLVAMVELIELAEWDPRNAGPGCTGHHRRLDNQATPSLVVPAEALPLQFLDFLVSWGFESDAERKFPGLAPVLANHLNPQEAARTAVSGRSTP